MYSPVLSTVGRFWMVILDSSLASVAAATSGPLSPANACPRLWPLRAKLRVPRPRSTLTDSTSPDLRGCKDGQAQGAF